MSASAGFLKISPSRGSRRFLLALSSTVNVCRKPSSARGYRPPEVRSEELGGMYHSAAITCATGWPSLA